MSAVLDLAGLFDPTGAADGANAVLLASSGDFGNAILCGVSILPMGDIVKAPKISKDIRIISDAVAKFHKHHIVPKSVYRDNIDLFKGVLKRDSKQNLIDLQAGFHGNHPAYKSWIQRISILCFNIVNTHDEVS